MKSFDVPLVYRSPLISAIKKKRKDQDRMKKDFSPTALDLGAVQFYLARHFGFCYGVENAIDIAFRTVEENPGKRIFLLSEMIHNPHVNEDLVSRGVRFLQDNKGHQLIPFESLHENDVVLIPAFGTTLAIESILRERGIPIEHYNTTCPFVEKVWNRSEAIAKNDYTIVIHGKPSHEETRATFSHASAEAPAVVVKDMAQAELLGQMILGQMSAATFYQLFQGQYSEGFDVEQHLQRIGVVNQTTMLATDTQAIADHLKGVMIEKYGLAPEEVKERFADTRDTLCYATNDNQSAVRNMLEMPADLAIVVGGYNSSNTSHLVELCEEKLPTYYISSASCILNRDTISHYDFHNKQEMVSSNWLPSSQARILVTSGASCPDALVEQVLKKIAGYYPATKTWELLEEGFSS